MKEIDCFKLKKSYPKILKLRHLFQNFPNKLDLNTFKLKKNFKELFGVPVFKYLQNERLTTAHELLRNKKATVQEAAWQVGYDSLSSFSNAFSKKFGYRPSDIKG